MAEAYRRNVVVRRFRGMREFAEKEIILPDGPFSGQRFRCARQPAHGLFFDEVDSGRWYRFACTGPQQSGKTLAFVVIPIMYHLFERKQSVLFGLTSMDMANDKWQMDIRPAIEMSPFAKYLPKVGAGAKGGTPELIKFTNGAVLKFITAGGRDEKRSGFTAPILVATEVSHLDVIGGKSDEATKIKQMEGRVRAFRKTGQARVYLESTVTVEEGRIWQEWQSGSQAEILFPCHSCDEYILLDRENLIGWQECQDEEEAEEKSRWACPKCGILFDDHTRDKQLKHSRLVHRGQSVDASGNVTGERPRTKTCGVRYSAGTNMFALAGMVGADEWRAKYREVDADNAERELRQWTWCIPADPKSTAVEPLDFKAIMHRQSEWYRGTTPSDTQRIAAGVDVRGRQLDWFVIAERENGQPVCIDYGFEPIHRELAGLDIAITQSIGLLVEKFDDGWTVEGTDTKRGIDLTLIDSGWETDTIRRAVRDNMLWKTAQGFGHNQHAGSSYNPPKKRSRHVLHIGEGWHDVLLTRDGQIIREYQNNADHWKRRVHQLLAVDPDGPFALLLPKTDRPDGRIEVAKQLTAEKELTSFEVGKGNVTKWVKTFVRNHLLDAAYMALCGLNILADEIERAKKKQESKPESGVVSGKKAARFVSR